MSRYVVLLLAVSMLAGCASYGATAGRVVIRNDTGTVDVRFSERDRALIRDYYEESAKHRKGLPPGLAKRGGDLPPGLARREQLPPGLRYEPLPQDLDRRLSPLPSSYLRVRVGQDIVLMDGKTHVVFDVIYGIAR
jgi:Ni/Co efflux regulator RcnB